jgi:hypothetical protein
MVEALEFWCLSLALRDLISAMKLGESFKRAFIILALIIFSSPAALATGFIGEGRLYGGVLNANPTNFNTEMAAEGMNDIKSLIKYGVEISYPLASFLKPGLRYEHLTASSSQIQSTSSSFSNSIAQESLQLVARVPIITGSIFRFDVFGAVGGSNTTIDLNSPTQNGSLTRLIKDGSFSSPRTTFGGSVAAGWKGFYLVAEYGLDSNKPDGFTRSSGVNNNIQNLDLSGSYVTIGLLLDGTLISGNSSNAK